MRGGWPLKDTGCMNKALPSSEMRKKPLQIAEEVMG